jgi:hypothetical protein
MHLCFGDHVLKLSLEMHPRHRNWWFLEHCIQDVRFQSEMTFRLQPHPTRCRTWIVYAIALCSIGFTYQWKSGTHQL